MLNNVWLALAERVVTGFGTQKWRVGDTERDQRNTESVDDDFGQVCWSASKFGSIM